MKATRQAKILEIIEMHDIETQDELLEALQNDGFNVTQATVSRDIKELKLVKISAGEGHQYYKPMNNMGALYNERIIRVFRESVLSIDVAYFMVVVRTLPGMAQAAALAIDALDWTEIVGAIAGDDTIFVAVRKESDGKKVAERFRKVIKGN